MLLLLHAAAGTAALVVGVLALAGFERALLPYRGLVLVVAVTALALVVGSSLPAAVRVLLAAVAIASGVGLVVPRERGLRASYVALVAALAFVSAPVWAGVVIVALGFAAVHGVPARAAVPG